MPEQSQTTPPVAPFPDRLTIRRVSNGWIVFAGRGGDEFEHVYAAPADVAKHVQAWAERQL